MRIIFILLWALMLLLPQLLIRVPFWGGYALTFNFLTLLVIYTGFNFRLVKGLISVIFIAYCGEIFSVAPHGSLVLAYCSLFVFIKLVIDRIYSEAYLTKSLWVFVFSLLNPLLFISAFHVEKELVLKNFLWIQIVTQAFVDASLSFPLFILIDSSFEKWNFIFSRKKAQITGADYYQVKSSQRKYF